MPAHLARLCETPLLSAQQESELFRRMNFCRYRAKSILSRISKTRPALDKVLLVEEYLLRSKRLRNYLITANTRLVMSIARRFADARNCFDDLFSHGVSSLMHAVEKFDYSRGYRFSTYATCAVRRDLYRMVMKKKTDHQRFATGTNGYLGDCIGEEPEDEALSESSWNHLSSSLNEIISHLDEREKLIVTSRFGLDNGKKTSYSTLGKRLGISKERVRQLANRALEKMRDSAAEYRLDALLT